MRTHGVLVVPLVVALASLGLASEQREMLIDSPVANIPSTDGTTPTILSLIRATHQGLTIPGVFGFYRIPGPEPQVTLGHLQSTVGESLQAICRQDPRFRFESTAVPYLVNILPTDERTAGQQLLAFRMPQIDIEADEWPDNLITELPDYSPDLSRYLSELYMRMGATNDNRAIAGAMTVPNPAPPHFSLHLKNVSVLEALNQIAARSFEQYSSVEMHFDIVGVDGVRRTLPPEKNFRPTGWMFQLIPPGNLSFPVWAQSLFKPL